MATELITIKVSPDARQMLRVLAAHNRKLLSQVVEDLAWTELKRQKLRLATNGHKEKRK